MAASSSSWPSHVVFAIALVNLDALGTMVALADRSSSAVEVLPRDACMLSHRCHRVLTKKALCWLVRVRKHVRGFAESSSTTCIRATAALLGIASTAVED